MSIKGRRGLWLVDIPRLVISKEELLTHECIYKTDRLTDIENKLMVTKGEGGRGVDKLGIWD